MGPDNDSVVVQNMPVDYMLTRGFRRRMKKELGLSYTPTREQALQSLLEAGKVLEDRGREKPVKVQRKAFDADRTL